VCISSVGKLFITHLIFIIVKKFFIVLIFDIYIKNILLFFITNTKHPRLELFPKDVKICIRNIGEQVDGDHEVNPMEENDNIDIIDNDGINRLIHDTLGPMDDNFDYVRDVPLIDKA